jgi:hypothetical protein
MAFHVRPDRDGDVLEECVERGELASGERQSPVRDSGLPGHSTLWGPMWRGMAQYRPANKGFDHSHGNMIEARLSVWYYLTYRRFPGEPSLLQILPSVPEVNAVQPILDRPVIPFGDSSTISARRIMWA